MLILLATSLATQSRATVVAFVLALSLILRKRKAVLFGLLAVLLLVVVLTPLKGRIFESKPVKYRIALNLINLNVMTDHPWFGIGFGMDTYGNKIDLERYHSKLPEICQFKIKEVFLQHTREPHNMFLSVGVRTGFIGLGLFIYVLIAYVKMVLHTCEAEKNPRRSVLSESLLAAISIFYVVGLFEQALSHVTETVFFTILAISTALWHLSRSQVR
jgi:O-antigen ligase